jgi:hypothetical protein
VVQDRAKTPRHIKHARFSRPMTAHSRKNCAYSLSARLLGSHRVFARSEQFLGHHFRLAKGLKPRRRGRAARLQPRHRGKSHFGWGLPMWYHDTTLHALAAACLEPGNATPLDLESASAATRSFAVRGRKAGQPIPAAASPLPSVGDAKRTLSVSRQLVDRPEVTRRQCCALRHRHHAMSGS